MNHAHRRRTAASPLVVTALDEAQAARAARALITMGYESVRVLATVSDDRALRNVTLTWEVDDEDNSRDSIEMVDDGQGDDGVEGNGIYGANIPPLADRSVIAFWIDALK